jgi:argininosuccinate lyase
MQEDKTPLFDTADILKACLDIYIQLLPNITINKAVMQKAAAGGYLNATDMADYLATKGVPFREAHHCVGQIVRYASGLEKEIHELSIKELQQHAPQIEDDIFDYLEVRQMINRRSSIGGTSTQTVKTAIEAAKQKLKKSAGRKKT